MVLRNQVEWALHCVVVLGKLPGGATLSTQALSELHGIPKDYLSKALQSLALAELIEGNPGPKGGYRLLRDPAKITFLDVVEAIEGASKNFQCTEIRMNNPCRLKRTRPSGICGIARVMGLADEKWRKSLRKTTIADILADLENSLPSDVAENTTLWISKRQGTRS